VNPSEQTAASRKSCCSRTTRKQATAPAPPLSVSFELEVAAPPHRKECVARSGFHHMADAGKSNVHPGNHQPAVATISITFLRVAIACGGSRSHTQHTPRPREWEPSHGHKSRPINEEAG